MKTKLKIYLLYDGPNGPTCWSKYYGNYGKNVWHVAALTVKQAYYLCAHNKWSEGFNHAGVVEYSPDLEDNKEKWIQINGDWLDYSIYKHGRKYVKQAI